MSMRLLLLLASLLVVLGARGSVGGGGVGWGCARRGSPGKTSVIHCFSDEQDEEYFTLAEIEKKLEGEKPCWKSKFKGGLEKIEVEHIEEGLKSRAAKGEVRYDFTFYTPTCRYVRVKVSFFYFIVFVD